MTIHNMDIIWNDIAIEISYDSDWGTAYQKAYGYRKIHLAVKSKNRRPIPIAKRGYRSRFLAASLVEEQGGVEAYVRKWLDQEAQSKEWNAYLEHSKQLSLL